jgi:hypothetical protein
MKPVVIIFNYHPTLFIVSTPCEMKNLWSLHHVISHGAITRRALTSPNLKYNMNTLTIFLTKKKKKRSLTFNLMSDWAEKTINMSRGPCLLFFTFHYVFFFNLVNIFKNLIILQAYYCNLSLNSFLLYFIWISCILIICVCYW